MRMQFETLEAQDRQARFKSSSKSSMNIRIPAQ